MEASSQWNEGPRAIPEPLFAEDCGKLWSRDLESNEAIKLLVHLLATQDIRSALQYSAETDNASNRLVNMFTKSRTDLS